MKKKLFLTLTSKLEKQFSIVHNIRRQICTDQSEVIVKDVKDKGVIILNRPKALNSLNISMVRKIYPTLKEWEDKKALVIVRGNGGKAFCAGGDVKSIVEAAKKGDKSVGRTGLKEQYLTNGLIGLYKIPYISFIDGIVMGGGVGISVHGKYIIATEKTLFAMPETQIGLFPDVGGSYFLPRLNGRLGWYLALTGHRLKGVDVLKAGIATHFCESSKLNELEEALLNCSNDQDITTALNKFSEADKGEFSLSSVTDKINHCFSANSVEEILVRLEKDGSAWADNTIKVLNKMSPTSLKVTCKEFELGQKLSLQECLQMEYRLAFNFLENKDFFEGVRAVLIDKDQNPKWDPPTLPEVTQNIVEKHFAAIPEEEELVFKL